jgi:uncharacterized membrane protein YcaP (DUF421 family)
VESVIRAAAVYLTLLVLFRITGRRSLGQVTTFDFVLLLIISEAIQNAMVGPGYSMTNGIVVVLTLVLIDIGLSFAKRGLPRLDKWIEGVPIVIVAEGKPLEDRMAKARIDLDDVLSTARKVHGLERLDQIKYAILERDGHISVIPAAGGAGRSDRAAA